jgi:hypothetical protein
MFHVWTEKPAPPPAPKKLDIQFSLRPKSGSAYEVACIAVDPKTGSQLHCGDLFTLTERGVVLHTDVNRQFPLQLDSLGRIVRASCK